MNFDFYRRKKAEEGFTLVEIAIVLIIIGIIMTAVLKSSAVEDKAKSVEFNQHLEELDTAVALYKDKIGIYPNATEAEPDYIHNGTKDGEQGMLPDLYNEGMITTSENTHPFDGEMNASYAVYNSSIDDGSAVGPDVDINWGGNYVEKQNIVEYTHVPPAYARKADETYDDENASTGRVRASNRYDNGTNEYIKVYWNLDG